MKVLDMVKLVSKHTTPVGGEDEEVEWYVLHTPCKQFKFLGKYRLTEEELSMAMEYSMFPYYKSFYTQEFEDEDSYVLVSEFVRKLMWFKDVDAEALFSGSYKDGWQITDFEKVHCLCRAFEYNEKDAQKKPPASTTPTEPTAPTAPTTPTEPREPTAPTANNKTEKVVDIDLTGLLDLATSLCKPKKENKTKMQNDTLKNTEKFLTNLAGDAVGNLMKGFMKDMLDGSKTKTEGSANNVENDDEKNGSNIEMTIHKVV